MDLVVMAAAVAFGIFAIVWLLRNDRPVWRSLGFTVNRWTLLDIVIGLAIPLAVIGLVFLVEWGLGAIRVAAGASDWSGLGGALGEIVFYAVFEEVLFRVLMLTALVILLRRLAAGRWIAVAVVALIFGAVHLTNENATLIGAFGTALGGLIYGIAYLGTRAIWLPLFLHISWNLSQALWGFPVSGSTRWPGWVTSTSVDGAELLNGGAYGPEAGLPGMLARVAIIALVFVYLKLIWPGGSIRTLTFAPDPVKRRVTAAAA
ncbi:CPBP family intramembrane glutamic endopeptidase [Microbacterium sp. NPDC058062]|uniref:CPBP family intramembrane glutamic endopeptidase n=1 Tax=Microbacterium sp. NPDC058062 TaxID=3346320 RepID=UPI0036DAFF58